MTPFPSVSPEWPPQAPFFSVASYGWYLRLCRGQLSMTWDICLPWTQREHTVPQPWQSCQLSLKPDELRTLNPKCPTGSSTTPLSSLWPPNSSSPTAPPSQRKIRNQSIAGSKSEEFITPPGRGKERPAAAVYHTEAPIQKDSPESTVKNLFGKKKKFFKTKTTKGKKILKYSVVTPAKNVLTI